MEEAKVGTVLNASLFGKIMTWGWFENPRLKESGMRVLTRAAYTCQSCGFASRPSRQVPHGFMVPVDRSHAGLASLNPETGTCLCPLCASVEGINWSVVGTVLGGQMVDPPGMFIILPAMSQVEINRLALHTLSIIASCGANMSSALASSARDVDAAMTALNQEVGISVPFYRGKDSDLARALALLTDEFYSQRDEIIGQLRWWPNMRYWREQGLYWMKSTYSTIQEKDAALQEVLAQ